ncbi:helix-turn-helix transcriptional regulator [Pedobacter sp. N36a]|uniref:helix-turn-helix domain-containing protein n=1 Tax=Pedobacter sp. N36a TaxID=2767996 RepID=UPI001656AEF5|nr:helix-turn-helix transcriptional regulator [Pedobacter sp. N36a]MBC8988406.1 helix-turn-helix transcriptional regulator [Pedobacter sp. N36a]
MPLNPSELITLKDFGENIRRIRLEKQWTMEYLANQANVELSQIYRIEKGKINPKLTTIVILCKALEVNPEQIISI